MRITFVLPFAGLQGGIRVLAIYAERLKRRGHDVVVVSTTEALGLRGKMRSLLPGRERLLAELSHFAGVGVDHRVLEAARPVTDADVPDADVVLASYYTTALGVLGLSPAKGAKAIFIQGYEVVDGRSNPALDATWRMPFHKITISKWLVELARDRFGDLNVSHVPNSVDTAQFYAVRREKGLVPTVGFLYATSFFKGVETSLNALKRIAAVTPTLRVVSFGAEHPNFRLPLPRSAEFHYRPRQDIIKDLYSKCDVWMCGSNSEGFHLPPLEAMACRCPVVSTRVGGPLDIIEESVNGYLVSVRDSAALADRALRVLRQTEAEWREMSCAAYRTANSYSWDQAVELFEKALELTVERTRRGEL